MSTRTDDRAVSAGIGNSKKQVRSGSEGTRAVYLDHNASSPLDPRVAEVMVAVLTNAGNAASAHSFGRRQATLVDHAREQVAALVGSGANNVVFTASATEANNLALRGAIQDAGMDRVRILVSAIEHDSVLKTAEWLRARGVSVVDVVPVTSSGFVDPDALKRLLGPDVLLVSVMAANGETGVLNPISELADLTHSNGSLFQRVPSGSDIVVNALLRVSVCQIPAVRFPLLGNLRTEPHLGSPKPP